MDFKSFVDLLKNIEKYILLSVVCFITSLVINILLAYNLSEYLNNLSKFSIYLIIVSIVSGMVIFYTIINQLIVFIRNSNKNKKNNIEFNSIHLTLTEDELEIIELLKNGPNNINPFMLKSNNTYNVKVLEAKNILKIIHSGSMTKKVNRGGFDYPKNYTQLLCSLTDEYKKHSKKQNKNF